MPQSNINRNYKIVIASPDLTVLQRKITDFMTKFHHNTAQQCDGLICIIIVVYYCMYNLLNSRLIVDGILQNIKFTKKQLV